MMHQNVGDQPRREGIIKGRTQCQPVSLCRGHPGGTQVGGTGFQASLGVQVQTPTQSDAMEGIEASKQHWLLAEPRQQAVPFCTGSS